MNKISELLNKFKSFGQKEKEEKEKIISVLKENIKTELKREDVDISDLRIKIKKTGVFRTELILKKPFILEEINKKTEVFYLDIN